MHLKRRDLYKLAAVGAAPLALASCGQASNLETGGGGGGDQEKPILTVNATEATLTRNLNPHSPSVIPMVQGMIYETLFYFNPLQAIDQEPQPQLGDTYAWNEDGTALTVAVRQGVTWTDGEPFTARDVAFTFTRISETEALNDGGTAPTAEASDDTTVVITYAEPSFTEGPNALGRTWILPEHLFTDVEDLATYPNEDPVGTGPFRLDDFSPESYLLVANEDYWEQGKPAIGGVRAITTSGNQSATDQWLAGNIDYMSAAIPSLEEHVESSPDLAFTNTGISQMALMAASNPELGCEGPQTDVAVRKALYYGMDREQLSKLAFFDLGADISPSFALPERDADFIDPSIEVAPWNARPDEATAVLEDAGYELGEDGVYAKDGVRVSMTVSCPTGWSDYATALDTLAQQYRELGIELIPQQVSVNEWNDSKAKGTYQLVIDSVGQGPAPDPYYPYRNHFSTESTVPVGENGNPYQNITRFSDPDVDAALDAASATDDPEAKKEQYFLIQQKLVDVMPAIPVLIGSSLTEYNTSRATGWPTEEDMYAYPMSWSAPDNAIVLKTVTPVQ
ncbi:ABC transporter substrate-binding protein [Brachybacterium fresconis]|uniref:Peptide/nickel transport system substrate-binding protein n=1 Tax=Brachybacterium fresconis TaxID=173363 RepID=A0ABS4YMF9_9MICO|nr:ABC transporter substrate-binding protein [Brachybacterium fresconis]MBP2409997.1 peptide/nickel transport system substrate-binding protein [Brachybacterium fresconis]